MNVCVEWVTRQQRLQLRVVLASEDGRLAWVTVDFGL
jgi:hypothetical protein